MNNNFRKFMVFTIIFLFIGVSIISGMASLKSIEDTKPSNQAKWTFMIYLDGDSDDLENKSLRLINQMELVGSNTDIQILVLFDDYKIWNHSTRIFNVIYDENNNTLGNYQENVNMWDIGEKNIGDPNTLVDFVKWTVDLYPAEKYFLTLFNHGGGWRSICSDTTQGDSLNASELKQAMSEINNYINKKIDVVFLQACFMGMIEIFYPIREYIDICLAPESSTSTYDMSYTNVLGYINQNPDANGKDVAEIIIDDYYHDIIGSHLLIVFGIYMEKVQDIIEEFNQLLIHLRNNLPSKEKLIWLNSYSNIDHAIPYYPYSNDIYLFCSKVKKLINNQEIEILADNIMKSIDASVIRPVEDEGPINDRTNGISIYYPPNSNDYLNEYYYYNYKEYEKLDFAKDTLWDEFLRDVFAKSKIKLYFNTPFLTFLDNHPYLFPLIRQILRLIKI